MKNRTDRVKEIVEHVLAESQEYPAGTRQDMARLWRDYLHPFRMRIVFSVILTIVLAAQPFAFALVTRFLVDHVLKLKSGVSPTFSPEQLSHQFRLVWIFIGMNAGIWAVYLISLWSHAWLTLATGQKLVYGLRKKLHEKLQALHIGFYERTATGRIMSRVLDDVEVIQGSITSQFITMAAYSAALAIGFAVMFYLNWKLALLVVFTLPFYGYAFHRVRPVIRRHNIVLRRLNSQLYGRVSERILGIQVVQAFGREIMELKSFARIVAERVRVYMRLVFYSQRLALVSVIISSVTTGIIIYIAMCQVKTGRMTLGSAMAFLAAVGPVFTPVNGLTNLAVQMQTLLVVLRRTFALLDEKEGVLPGKIKLAGMVGKIRFDHVTFTYPGQEKPALNDVNFEALPGERIAVMGPSGSGKSTIFHLLLRFYDPSKGKVYVGGVNLVDADPVSVRWHVCMVQQEPVVFSGTIAANIMYGRLDATPREVMNAAKNAEMHDFIMSLPLKYETEVGEQGVTLSGGQRQRLALATALVTDPEVLLLDDTSSALDAVTEARIRETLNKVLEGRTSLTITQRVITARNADRIIVLEDGRITQMGSHDDLKRQDGFYKRICIQQRMML